jgi:hypothetical protein
MPSYQDIEIRLRTVEHKLEFIMNTIQLQVIMGNGLFDRNGQPLGERQQKSLLQMYHMAHQLGQPEVIDAESTEINTAGENSQEL